MANKYSDHSPKGVGELTGEMWRAAMMVMLVLGCTFFF